MQAASLVVKLAAETAEFHRKIEEAAHLMERTGRRMARVGREISEFVTLPLVAIGVLAYKAALEQSKRAGGEFAGSVSMMKDELHHLFEEIGVSLLPIFEKLIKWIRETIAYIETWVKWWRSLSEGTRETIVTILAVVAALGPTLIIIGKVIRLIGGLILIIKAIGLVALGWIAVIALVIAAGVLLYTHWDKVRYYGAKAWYAIEVAVLKSMDAILGAIESLLIRFNAPQGLINTVEDARAGLVMQEREAIRASAALHLLGKAAADAGPQIKSLAEITKEKLISEEMIKLGESLREAQVAASGFGASFDLLSAQASAYHSVIEALIKGHVTLDEKLNASGLTMRDLMQTYNEIQHRAEAYKKITEALITPLQKYQQAIADANDLLNRHLLTQQQHDAYLKIALKEYQAAIEKADEFRDLWKRALRQTQDAFADFFFNVFSGGVRTFEQLIKAILELWLKMLSQIMAAKLFKILINAIPALGGAGAGAGAGIDTGGGGGNGYEWASVRAPDSFGSATVIHQTVNLNVSALDAASVTEMLHSQRGVISGIVLKATQQSVGFRQALLSGRGG